MSKKNSFKSKINRVINFLFGMELELKHIIFNMISFMGFVGGTISFLVVLGFGISSERLFSIFASLVILVVCFYLVNFKKVLKLGGTLLAVLVTCCLFPYMFFTGGGIRGAMPFWYLYGSVFAYTLLQGKLIIVISVLQIAIYTATFVVQYMRPELVKDLNSELIYFVDLYQGYFVVAVSIVIIFLFYETVYRKVIRINEEQKKALEIAVKEAEVANNAKSDFLARVSHEVRTPINAVIGMNEMILRVSEEETVRDYAMDSKSAANTLLSIINGLLDMSKIEAGKMELYPVSYDLCNMINDVVALINLRAIEKGLKFKLDINPDLPSVLFGDDIRIKQIITNILTNGVKYTNTGSVTLKIDGVFHDDMITLKVCVSDTGIGIKEEDIPRVFNKFDRINEKNAPAVEGVGLGMNITVSLLELMGSKLKVESQYGIGSDFSFELEQKVLNYEAIGDLNSRIKNLARDYKYTQSFIAPKANILVIDDNALNRKVFMELLKNTGMTIEQGISGKEFLSKTGKKKYDLIFLDDMMPGLSGREAFAMMKQDYTNPCHDVPVVMLTANAVAGAQEQYLTEGFAGFLSKPIMVDRLEDIICNLLPPGYIQFNRIQSEEGDKHHGNLSFESEKGDEENGILPEIPGFVWKTARKYIQNNDELIMDILYDFYESIEDTIYSLKQASQAVYQKNGLELYRIKVHGLKSTVATLGAENLTLLAKKLERAALEDNAQTVETMTPVLLEELAQCRANLASILTEKEEATAEKSKEEFEKTILVVDDNKTNLLAIRSILKYQYNLVEFLDGASALEYLAKNRVDLILLDVFMPFMGGFETYDKIKQTDINKDTPVIFITATQDAGTESKGLNMGAIDYLYKPFVPEIMLARVSRAMELADLRVGLTSNLKKKTDEAAQYKEKSEHDVLTGLWNREYFEAKVKEAVKKGKKFSIYMMDMNSFKAINDTLGHGMGDRVLRMFAEVLRSHAKERDVICRLGGDEFLIMEDRSKNREEKADFAEAIAVDFVERIIDSGIKVETSVAIGIAEYPEHGEDFKSLYKAADKALYSVKKDKEVTYGFYENLD